MGNGGYAAFSHPQKSKYTGVFFAREETLVKIVEDIRFSDPKEGMEELSKGKRKWKDGTEESFSFYDDVFCYEKDSDDEVQILLDIKQSYDNREFGRCYTVQKKDTNTICVKFHKKNDHQEDIGSEYQEDCFLQVEGECVLEKKWIPKMYPFDAQRERSKEERYVFLLLRTCARKIFLSEKPNAIPKKKALKTLSQTASKCSQDALLTLVSNMHGRSGLLAGHPWFFQYWTRDEAISVKGLWLAGKKKLAKEILLNAICHIDAYGRIPNRIPEADIGCADGVGWTFFRLKELHEEGHLNKKEADQVKKQLKASLFRIEKNLMDDGLVQNNRLETWMDTDFQDDNRIGKRIEIQTLTLEMYRFLFLLSGSQAVRQKAKKLKEKIREVFWNGQYIKDGSSDETIRSNLFFAYYTSPDLLTKKQWKKCFDIAIDKLWIDWGGLATIDKGSHLFCETHTGQNNQSYHRGDSWYFVNNIAAICFLRLNKKYVQYAEKILHASQKDILQLGARGCASEISSAKEQTSEGCFNQAWSNATFLELTEEVRILGE